MNKKIYDKIKDWCIEENLSLKKVNDQKANFHFSVGYPIGSNIDILQPKGKDDSIIIAAGVTVSPEHISKITKLKKETREEFLWDFRFILGNRPTEFNLNHPNGILNAFSITKALYDDGLTKDKFMNTLQEIHKTKLLGIWEIQKRFGVPKQGEKSADSSLHSGMYG